MEYTSKTETRNVKISKTSLLEHSMNASHCHIWVVYVWFVTKVLLKFIFLWRKQYCILLFWQKRKGE